MASFPSLLGPLQQRVLERVAAHLQGFFLTGGTALGVYYLGHRRSEDLDLFTRDANAYDEGGRQFVRLMKLDGLTVTAGSAGPGFHRFIVSDGRDDVPVDLVLDTPSPPRSCARSSTRCARGS